MVWGGVMETVQTINVPVCTSKYCVIIVMKVRKKKTVDSFKKPSGRQFSRGIECWCWM